MANQVIKRIPNLPLGGNMRTTFVCEADYKIPIATASITTGAVKLNSPWLPFRPGGSSAFPSFTFQGPATESTLMPTGWTNLTGVNLFQYNKVLRSRIELRWNGSNSGNNVVVTVVPALNTASFADVYSARTAPFARQATFSVSKANTGCRRDGYMSCSIDPYRLLGANLPEQKGDLQVLNGIYNADPIVTQWWFIYFQSNDMDVSSTTASLLQVRVVYDCELLEITQMSRT